MSKFAPMITSNRWTPADEAALLELWQSQDLYTFHPNSGRKIYSVDTPPPYLSGHVHIGQLIHYTQIDMIARYRRMQGLEVNFPLGLDRNGLPVELRVEKEFGIDMHTTPRGEFVKRCKEQLDLYETEVVETFRRIGIGFNTYAPSGSYRTDSPEYRSVTQATFIELWNNGLIYSDYRPNNWCRECGTTIADAEVEYVERETTLNYLHFEVEGLPPIDIATTRPELLCACGAIFVHPDDERYRNYVGRTAIVPLFGLRVPIIESTVAQIEFGTGSLMVCSYGDMSDVMAFRDYGLRPIVAISPEGKMTEAAGKYAGMSILEARQAILEALQTTGVLYKQEKINQRVPICWRSKTPIEFIPMDEYYLRQTEFIRPLMQVAKEIKFFPDFHRQILLDWLERVTTDWPISRRRYYGTEIPIWYCNSCGAAVVPAIEDPPRYYQPWREDPPFKTCPKCGASKGFRGEERTFDTWMDSSISGLQIIGYRRDATLFESGINSVIRPQGKDIVRTWLYYSLLRTYQLLKRPAFKEVWISGHVVDEKGQKMSKSRGNSPDPNPFLEKYGADALRMFGVLEAGLGSDIRFSEERLAGAAKFMTKLWNIARFISMFPVPKKIPFQRLTPVDQWILAELNRVIESIQSDCEALDFHRPTTEIRSFTWNFLADHVIELVKGRCLNNDERFTESEQKSAWYALHESLRTILLVLAPITPFITDRIYRELYSPNGIHRERYPRPVKSWSSPLTQYTSLLLKVNAAIWKFKRENNLSLRQGISAVYIPESLSPWARDLEVMHNITDLHIAPPKDTTGLIKVQLEATDEAIYVQL